MNLRSLLTLVVAIAVPLLAGGIGGIVSAQAIPTWYQQLEKPAWNPPNWLFGPVWTALYISMGIAAWLVWRQPDFNGRTTHAAAGFLDGANAASVALMATVTWELGRAAVVDWLTAAIALAAAAVLLATRLNSVWLVAGGAAVGALGPLLR